MSQNKSIRYQMEELLADGRKHSKEELQQFCKPGSTLSVSYHISLLRKEIPLDQWIVCEVVNRRAYYRRVKLLYTRSVVENELNTVAKALGVKPEEIEALKNKDKK